MVSPKEHYRPIVCTSTDNGPVPKVGLASGRASDQFKINSLNNFSMIAVVTLRSPWLNELILENEVPLKGCEWSDCCYLTAVTVREQPSNPYYHGRLDVKW